jgi:hypothetical protein
MSTREKFIVSGTEYEAISRSADAGVRLAKFRDFAINPAHIVSAVLLDVGALKISEPDKYKVISDEQREENLQKFADLKEKLWKK